MITSSGGPGSGASGISGVTTISICYINFLNLGGSFHSGNPGSFFILVTLEQWCHFVAEGLDRL
jgi:hypothetical protein